MSSEEPVAPSNAAAAPAAKTVSNKTDSSATGAWIETAFAVFFTVVAVVCVSFLAAMIGLA